MNLNEINDRLRDVRKAREAAKLMREGLAQNPKRSTSVTVSVGMAIGHFSDPWPNQTWTHPALDAALRARLAENLTTALNTADGDLRAEERHLCEEMVRAAAKIAAGGL